MRARVSLTTADSSMTKTLFIGGSLTVYWRAGGFADGDIDEKRSPDPSFAFDCDISPMLLNNLVGDGKPQTAPFVLISKKRIEDMIQILFRDSHAGILYFHLNELLGLHPLVL